MLKMKIVSTSVRTAAWWRTHRKPSAMSCRMWVRCSGSRPCGGRTMRDTSTAASPTSTTWAANGHAAPIGAAMFAVGAAWPFAAQVVLVGLAAVLVSRIVLPPHGRDRAERTHIRHDIAEGFRWVRHHAAVRTLVLTIFIFNITFGAAWSVLVLYATRRLGMGEIGFGLLTTASAAGGLAVV